MGWEWKLDEALVWAGVVPKPRTIVGCSLPGLGVCPSLACLSCLQAAQGHSQKPVPWVIRSARRKVGFERGRSSLLGARRDPQV